MANRERGVKINFWVTPEEQKLIEGKMEKAGIRNMSAYLRKLAIDGYIVRLDVPLRTDISIGGDWRACK